MVIVLMGLLAGAALADQPLKGAYVLQFGEDVGWHSNTLMISGTDNGVVRGTVGIDWNLGPEARAPKPDEKLHNLPFEGRWSKSGAIHFTVTVGGQTSYAFELFPMHGRFEGFVGVVTVDTTVKDGLQRAGPARMGVVALPSR